LPLAIMGVRVRVRHQTTGSAHEGTIILSVLPETVLDHSPSHHAVAAPSAGFSQSDEACASHPPFCDGMSRRSLRCGCAIARRAVDLVARH
jgi:hypothetical protein